MICCAPAAAPPAPFFIPSRRIITGVGKWPGLRSPEFCSSPSSRTPPLFCIRFRSISPSTFCFGLVLVGSCRPLREPVAGDRGHACARRPDRLCDRPRHRPRNRRRSLLGRFRRPTRGISPQLRADRAAVPRPDARRQARRMARAGAAREPVPLSGAGTPLQNPRYQRHHRRPRRRCVRDRLRRWHAGDSAVRSQRAPARRRFGRLDEEEPRPPRSRHPAEDPENVRRRRHDLRRGLSRTSRKSTSS